MTDERPHVVEPVGQLDDQHPPVVGHGHEHLAHGGGLLGLLGVELEAVELGDPVDDQGHGRAEVALDDLGGHPGVLDGVVQQGGGHRLGVEAQVGHDAGHGDGVGDVGLARAPQLPGVGDGGRLRRPDDQRGVVPGVPAQERAWSTGASSAASAAGSDDAGQVRPRPLSAVPSAGTGVARAIPTRYLDGPDDRYLAGRTDGRSRRSAAACPSPPFPLPFRGRGGGRLPAGRVDPARRPAGAGAASVRPRWPSRPVRGCTRPAAVAVPDRRFAGRRTAPGRITPVVGCDPRPDARPSRRRHRPWPRPWPG